MGGIIACLGGEGKDEGKSSRFTVHSKRKEATYKENKVKLKNGFSSKNYL